MSLDTNTGPAGKPQRQLPEQVGTPPTPDIPASWRVKERRNPLVFAVMVAITVAGALIFAWAYNSADDSQPVLAMVADVQRGEVINNGDLKVVRVGVDPALTPISGSEKGSIVGKRASSDLRAGTLLTEGVVAEKLVPGEGDSLVGISLTPAQMPSEALYAGDTVRIVTALDDEGQSAYKAPSAVQAVVVGATRIEETGETVVNVAVPHEDAAELAAYAASGKVALVLDSRER